MVPQLLAIFAAVFFGLNVTLIRKGLKESNILSAYFITTITGIVIVSILAGLFVRFSEINYNSITFFFIAGILSPALTSFLFFNGMEKLGAAMCTSIFATSPLFSSFIAILLLNERPTFGTWAGTVVIVVGVVVIERSTALSNASWKAPSKRNLIYPFSAAFSHSLGFSLRKIGLNIYGEPLLGILLGYLASLCLITVLFMVSNRILTSSSIKMFGKRDFQLFWHGGFFFFLGLLCSFYGLEHRDVTTVGPLLNTQPLFVIIFVYLLLQKLEKVTTKLVLGTFIIMLGAAAITIF